MTRDQNQAAEPQVAHALRFWTERPRHKRSEPQRLLSGVIDLRAWLHLFRLKNYCSYAHIRHRRHMTIGPGCGISLTATCAYGERTALGARVVVGDNTRLWAGMETARITVGEDTLIAPNMLITGMNCQFHAGRPIHEKDMLATDFVIGTAVIILAGRWIGAGAVIGARAAVIRGVSVFPAAVGVPASVIRRCWVEPAPSDPAPVAEPA